MSTDEGVRADTGATPAEPQPADKPADIEPAGDAPRFWHRDHPVFTPLAGFFTGLLLVIVVLGAFWWLLEAVFEYDVSAHLWVFALALGVLLAINLALVVNPRTRRFARYMLFGVVITPAVVLLVGALAFYVLLQTDG
ncbi:hypothetical protein GCM10023340_33620 [Nocardioides marinquilinus]|uniref:Uncharacterized protein n=1 Tax=Nocardioides marinquilinus TaxID=1210400 RepID=A0ABP9PV58_9ACTN